MIKQVFHLPKKITNEINKFSESSSFQLKAETSLKTVKQQCKFHLNKMELANVENVAQQILKQYDRAIIIGMGGAILSSRAFAASQNYFSKDFSLIYSDSLSAQKQATIFTKDNLQNAAIIIISRSGNIIETISQTNAIITKYYQYFGKDYELNKHFFIITKDAGPEHNNLPNHATRQFLEDG